MPDALKAFLTRLSNLAEATRALSGWHRYALAFIAGLIGALTMAPVGAIFLLPLAFSILILLIDGADVGERPIRRSFAAGWWFGFGYFLAGIYWMAFSFFVQADEFAWMAPFAVTAMPAGLALFIGGACALSRAFWRPGWRRLFLFTAVFSLFEFARGHILTGLPWNLTGQALAGVPLLAQSAAWWGVYGLSLIAIFLATAPAAGLEKNASPVRMLSGFGVTIIGVFMLFGFGALRVAIAEPQAQMNAQLRIVQPNVPQRDKIDPTKWGENFYRNLNLSTAPATEGRKLFIIWPENAAPLLDETSAALDVLSAKLPRRATLIAGAVRREFHDDGAQTFYNSIAILEETANGREVVGNYDKHHLVPFGEYLPFYGLLDAIGLAQLAPYGDAGFAAGDGPAVIAAGGAVFAPLICYESIFPGALYPRNARPEWLVTVTNDAWFGDTSGPRQHLDQARLRAIEAGLPMARAANTGVSALIDAHGRIIERIPLYEAGVIDRELPASLRPTLYHKFGDIIFLFMAIASLFTAYRPGLSTRVAE